MRHASIEHHGNKMDVMGRGYKPFEHKIDGLKDYRYSVIIENISAEWIGKSGYRCKSVYVELYEADTREESLAVNYLAQRPQDRTHQRSKHFPLLITRESEYVIKVNFSLKIYKKVFLGRQMPISFKRRDIKAPETYQELLEKAVIRIKINKSKKSLELRI